MNVDLRNRAPSVERLPDSRQRVTRVYDVLNEIPKNAASVLASVWQAWGTSDAGYTSCRLVKQSVAGQPSEFPDTSKRPPTLTRVYEEISATAETQVGGIDISYDQNKNKTVTITTLQFSTNAASYGTVGTSTAPSPNSECVLKEVITKDDGTLREIKRVYIDKGQLEQVDTLKFGGKVLLRRIKSLNEEPVTPTGFTRVETSIYFIGGLKVYEYGYATAAAAAGGGGVISQDTRYGQSTNEGGIGTTVVTIKTAVEPGATIQPTSLAGFVLISKESSDDPGYRIWTTVWAKGTGLVVDEVEKKNNNLLYIYKRTALGEAPTAPSASISGTVVLISDNVRKADGYDIYDRTWAEGKGEIGRDIDYSQSVNQGTVGVTKTTIRYLVAPGATVLPTALSGSIEVGRSVVEQDGYRIWTTVWAKGIGLVSSDVETKNGGKLVMYRRSALAAVPDTPSATIGGTVTLVSDNSRNSDGFVIYDRVWAEGKGQISQDDDIKNNGALLTTTIRHLTAIGAANPISTPGGYTLTSSSYAEQDGYGLWTAAFAKGSGQISQDDDTKNNGKLLLRTIRHLTAPGASNPISTPATYVAVTISYAEQDGHMLWTGTFAKGTGEISRDIDYSQSSNQGTIGVTKTTIRHLVAPDATIQPTSLSGSVLVGQGYAQQDGYGVWTTTWAKGAGQVVASVDTKDGGKLIVYKRTALGAAPDAPTATIGGTVTLISTNVRASDGFDVYDYVWAEGFGEVSRSIQYNESSNAGTVGATVTTIIHLTAASETTDPTSAPSGTAKISSVPNVQDGYRVWTVTYAKGTGTVMTSIDTKNNGALLIQTIKALGAAPSTPTDYTLIETNVQESEGYQVFTYRYAKGTGEISRDIRYGQSIDEGATIGTTVTTIRHIVPTSPGTMLPATLSGSVLIAKDVAESDGNRIWTTVWAKGVGLVLDESSVIAKDALVSYHRIALGTAPTAPSASIGGTVTLVESSTRKDSGYEVFDYRWAEGDGESSIELQGEGDGALVYTVVTNTAAKSTPAYPGSGTAYLVNLTQVAQNGFYRNTAVYKKPPVTVTLKKPVLWSKPGGISILSPDDGFIINPGAKIMRLADVEISYATSQITTTPFSVNAWAGLTFSYSTRRPDPANPGEYLADPPTFSVQQLQGILATATSASGTDSTFNGMDCASWSYSFSSSDPTTLPSNPLTVQVKNSIYLTATDGTVVYRREVTTLSV